MSRVDFFNPEDSLELTQLTKSQRELLAGAVMHLAVDEAAQFDSEELGEIDSYENDMTPLTSSIELPREYVDSIDNDEQESIDIPDVTVSSNIPEISSAERKKFAPLVPNEELVAQFQAGDNDKINELIKQNMGLIRYLADKVTRTRNRGSSNAIDKDDLIEEGIIALWDCALKFKSTDPETKFVSYARRAIMRAMRGQSQVFSSAMFSGMTPNSYVSGYARDTEETRAKHTSVLNGMNRLNSSARPLSLDTVPSETDHRYNRGYHDHVVDAGRAFLTSLTTEVSDEDPFIHTMKGLDAEELESLMSVLTEREQIILSQRYGLGETAQMDRSDVGKDFGISPGRVRQIEVSAFEKLRYETERRGARFRKKLLDNKRAKIRMGAK